MTPATFDLLASLLRGASGLVIGPDKHYLLETRLAAILQQNKFADLDALAARLRLGGTADLERKVVEAMTTNESLFFRDEKPFTHLRTQVVPRLQTERPAGAKLRIWSAASSSGQEAYSIAMLIAEMRAQLNGRAIEIIGTDISREQVVRAQEGLYTQFEIQRGLPMQMLVKYFEKDGGNWRIKQAIRAMTAFREWNLLSDLGALGKFDVVFCRNVLIYFDQPTKARVLEAIARQMSPDGVLYLGGAETVLGITTRFAPIVQERGVYSVVAIEPRRAMAAAR